VKLPPTTIRLPTWTIALTRPSSTFGVVFTGSAPTTTAWAWLTAAAGPAGSPSAAATKTSPASRRRR
jgi:hypothetical protein